MLLKVGALLVKGIRVHLEKLPSQKVREETKRHWKNALDDFARSAES